MRRQKVVACIRVGQLLHTLHVSKMISRDKGDQEREPRKKSENHDRNLKRLVTLPTLFSEPKTKKVFFCAVKKQLHATCPVDLALKSGVMIADPPTSASLRLPRHITHCVSGLSKTKNTSNIFGYSRHTAAMGRRAPRSRTTRRFSRGHLADGSIGSILMLSSVSAPSRVPQVVCYASWYQ